MAGLSADIINPFLAAGMQMLRDVSQVETKLGKPVAKQAKFNEDSIVIIIGITGEMKGQVMLAFPKEIACLVAGNMCMSPTDTISELHMLSLIHI